MKIIVTGKNGILSSELQKIDTNIIALDSINYNVSNKSIIQKLTTLNPDIIIHAAAMTNSVEVENNPLQAIQTNIIGTANISEYCLINNKRLVYISTDYIYTNSVNEASEDDIPIHGNNWYSYTKLLGDSYVQLNENNLVLRGTHKKYPFPYN